MTSKPSSNGNNGAPADEYKVGPGRPPKEYRFKPGQSGNPKGRKPRPPSLLLDLKRLFVQCLGEKVTLKQGDRERTLTMAEAGFKQLAAQFAKGDRYARRDVFYYGEKFGVDLLAGPYKAISDDVAEAARASSAYVLSDEVLDRLTTSAVDEIRKAVEEVEAEKKKKLH